MSNVESFAHQLSSAGAIKPYAMLDTNRDEEIAPDELVTPPAPRDDGAEAQDIPTVSSAETLTDPVAAALLEVHLADDPTSTIQSAVAAYRGTNAAD